MTERSPDHEPKPADHWDSFAEAMDLTIEGHRLIAQEIVYETKLLWRMVADSVREWLAAARRSAPPA